MAGSISPGMIESVLGRVYEALAQTSARSAAPEEQQDRLLAQAYAQACDVLDGWLSGPEWNALAPPRASAREPVATAIADWNHVRQFLEPVVETLNRIRELREDVPGAPVVPGAPEIDDPSAYIDDMIAAIQYTSRRYQRLDRRQLFIDATQKSRAVRRQVCALAAGFHDRQASQQDKAERRSRAIRLLNAVADLLVTLNLTMAGASPAALRQDIPQWSHEVMNVLFVHQVAHTAPRTARRPALA